MKKHLQMSLISYQTRVIYLLWSLVRLKRMQLPRNCYHQWKLRGYKCNSNRELLLLILYGTYEGLFWCIFNALPFWKFCKESNFISDHHQNIRQPVKKHAKCVDRSAIVEQHFNITCYCNIISWIVFLTHLIYCLHWVNYSHNSSNHRNNRAIRVVMESDLIIQQLHQE